MTAAERRRSGEHDGKVALITGGARGQGRSHAMALTAAGAAVVLVDAPEGIDTTPYALSSREDLERTAEDTVAAGGHCLAHAAHVRSVDAMSEVVRQTVEHFGRLDFVLANRTPRPCAAGVR